MSDERFERDLRAVLDEDAPRAVPDDLRRRVAAIPSTNPIVAGPVAPIWRRPVPLGIGLLAAAAIVMAVGLTRLQVLPQGVGATPGATTPGTTAPGTTAPGTTAPGTTAPSSTAPSAAVVSPSASPAVAACKG